jgi:TM2 domain-containing membrane protein YozV
MLARVSEQDPGEQAEPTQPLRQPWTQQPRQPPPAPPTQHLPQAQPPYRPAYPPAVPPAYPQPPVPYGQQPPPPYGPATGYYGQQPVPYGGRPMVVAPKSPGVALLASFFVPGLGSMINGEAGKGIGILAGYLVSLLFVLVVIGIFGVIGFWVWGMVDAYQGARKWNLRHGILS